MGEVGHPGARSAKVYLEGSMSSYKLGGRGLGFF